MKKKNPYFAISILLIACLLTYQSEAQNINFISTNGTNTPINVSSINSIVFSNDNMIVNTSDCEDQYFSVHYTSQVNFDENVNVSKINNSLNDEIKAYPNPASESIYINTSGSKKNNYILIYNMKGEKVYESKNITSPMHKVDLSSYPSGIYLISNGLQNTKFLKL